jgi:hypothetical protein
MTPQSHFMVVAPIEPHQEAALRALLATMNYRPGAVKPQNDLVPFGQFDRLHFARFIILDDPTLDDITVYRVPRPAITPSLAFLGDCDGSAYDFLADLVRRAGAGLRRIFSTPGFASDGDLLSWMRDHESPFCPHIRELVGRAVRQIREEEGALRRRGGVRRRQRSALAGQRLQESREALRQFVDAEIRAGHLTLTLRVPAFLAGA